MNTTPTEAPANHASRTDCEAGSLPDWSACISVSEAAKRIPTRSKSGYADPQSVRRWILNGRPGVGGKLVKLEGILFGSRMYVPPDAIGRFLDALKSDPLPVKAPASLKDRKRRSKAAKKELRAMGVKC